VPGIEAVIMARPTMSLGKYLQMIGRGLRVAKDKPFTVIIDHVGNVKKHGLPCSRRVWTLDRIIKRRDKVNLIRICKNWKCNAPFDRVLSVCPYCNQEDVPAPRGEGGGRVPLEEVDGDLVLLDPETIRELEALVHLEDPASVAQRVSKAAGPVAGVAAMKNQRERIETQKEFVDVIAHWAGKVKKSGYSDRMIHKRFYMLWGMTITQALSEPKATMLSLMEEVKNDYGS